jgi:hypothetical protein
MGHVPAYAASQLIQLGGTDDLLSAPGVYVSSCGYNRRWHCIGRSRMPGPMASDAAISVKRSDSQYRLGYRNGRVSSGNCCTSTNGAPGAVSDASAVSISTDVRTEKCPAGATSRWHRLPNESVNSTAGTLGDNTYSSRAIHCCRPLRGRSMSKNGVGTGIWNSRKQDAFNHITILYWL